MLTGLRGLAQSFVRGAVRIGRALESTYTALSELNLGYAKRLFKLDYDTYDEAYAKVQPVRDLNKDYIIPGRFHSESRTTLKTKFKYDMVTEWETMEGKIIDQHTSVSSNIRLTRNEIEEAASTQMEDYSPEGAIFHGEYEVEGAWYKS